VKRGVRGWLNGAGKEVQDGVRDGGRVHSASKGRGGGAVPAPQRTRNQDVKKLYSVRFCGRLMTGSMGEGPWGEGGFRGCDESHPSQCSSSCLAWLQPSS
jgi:hypothetical protein